MNRQDRHILRELGQQPMRPMVMIDQIPWHEMDVDTQLRLRTEDPWCRGVEQQLRRTLYKWHHMPGDMVSRRLSTCQK